jgi:hypothetical protein
MKEPRAFGSLLIFFLILSAQELERRIYPAARRDNPRRPTEVGVPPNQSSRG